MKSETHEQAEFVPEVDAASLQGVALPPGDNAPSPEAGGLPRLPEDPAEALRVLPPALAGHIQDLIAQADAEGYLRGRNEQIEATQHFDNSDNDDTLPTMPRYNRHSIWDL